VSVVVVAEGRRTRRGGGRMTRKGGGRRTRRGGRINCVVKRERRNRAALQSGEGSCVTHVRGRNVSVRVVGPMHLLPTSLPSSA